MSNQQGPQESQREDQQGQPGARQQSQSENQQHAQPDTHPDLDGLANKKPEELTPEELRLMADTMPGEGPGD